MNINFPYDQWKSSAKTRIYRVRTRSSRRDFGRPRSQFNPQWTFSEIMQFIPDETDRYRYFVWFFDTHLAEYVRDHRFYFSKKNRGFGEDAFHAMWWKLLLELHPIQTLELGVYRGQTLSLWELISKKENLEIQAWGVSPLIDLGDTVSKYHYIDDYESDVQSHFHRFQLAKANLVRGKSQDDASVKFIEAHEWDLIYIDGSHNHEDVAHDLLLSKACLRSGGYLVMDDASLFSSYLPPAFSFGGHAGPSSVVNDTDLMVGLTEIGTCGHNRIYMKL